MARTGIMLCSNYNPKRLAKWGKPWLIQPKLNGFRCRVPIDNRGNFSLLSSQGNPMTQLPLITSAIRELGLRDIELDGEMYCHGMPLEQIASICKQQYGVSPLQTELEYWVFDYVSQEIQRDRDRQLDAILPMSGKVRYVVTGIATEESHLDACMKDFLAQGFEGFVIRNPDGLYERNRRSPNMMKAKPNYRAICTIIGWKEEVSIHGELKGRIGSLCCITEEGAPVDVGSGIDNETSELLWKIRDYLKGSKVAVKYFEKTTSGSLRHPVYKGIIS